MSEENVEIVRKLFEVGNAVAQGEMSNEAATELFDPQFEFHWHDERTMPDAPQHLRGTEQFIEFFEQVGSAWVDLAWEPLEFVEAPGDRVVTLSSQSGRGRESGVPHVIHAFHVWTIRDGKVRKIELFRHRADALEAAGLRE